ncbi:hypothetical protein N8344_01750 [bacterium]|nr:hypothetical protein [bacterium]
MTEKFYRNLKTGKGYEEQALQLIHKKYPQAYIKDGYHKEWDIYVPELDIGIEVKSDAQHKSTGNYFLEYYCRNKASGISSTKAEYFFIYLDELYIIKTDTLRDIFIKYKGTNKDKIGGDDRKSLGIIISLKELKYETR